MIIAHVDMDAFFASIELRDRPDLRGRPVVVAYDRARAVVAAASYPARRFGVRSAMPLAEARRLCPGLVVVPGRMDRYREVSAEVMEILAAYTDRVEVAGLDEAYLDLSGSPAPKARARSLKSDIRTATGLTGSVGIGPNKLIAKIASDRDKPDGLSYLSVAEFRREYGRSSVRVIPGVGPKTEAKLAEFGITAVADLGAADPARLAPSIGESTARLLLRRAVGIDDRDLETVRIPKSESRERTFDRDLSDRAALGQALGELAVPVIAGLGKKGLHGRTVTVKVRFAPFTTRTRSRTADRPPSDAAELAGIGSELLRDLLEADRAPVRLLGIGVSSLERADAAAEMSLF